MGLLEISETDCLLFHKLFWDVDSVEKICNSCCRSKKLIDLRYLSDLQQPASSVDNRVCSTNNLDITVMYKHGQKVWSDVLLTFKSQVTSATFRTWFAGSYVLEYKTVGDKKLLIIAVGNSFLKEQIEKRYLPLINSFLLKKDLFDVEVLFVVSQKENKAVDVNAPLFSGKALELNTNYKKVESISVENSFDNFVVGQSNNLAYIAAKSISGSMGKIYNPFFIYGPTGVGKTHLLQAVGNDVLSNHVNGKVLYVTAEKFTNDYIESLKNKTQEAFRFKYRKVDLLLVDDVQFLAGKESTQDEFFHTFNDLLLSSKQVVLACDRHPRDLGRLKERLVSRFLGGMTVDIGLLDVEMKTAIIRLKCARRDIHLDSELVDFISQNSGGSARELEGLLTIVLAHIKIKGSGDFSQIKAAVIKTSQDSQVKPTIASVTEAVSRHFKIDWGEIKGQSRKSKIVYARQAAMYFLRRDAGLSLGQIGDMLGGRDHSTVIHGVNKMENMVSLDVDKRDEILRIKSVFGK